MKRCLLKGLFLFGFFLVSGQSLGEQTRVERDPTQPEYIDVTPSAEEKETPDASYVLTSIIVSPTRRVALINAKYVTVGDKLGAARVKRIHRNSVVLSVPGKEITLYLIDRQGWE